MHRFYLSAPPDGATVAIHGDLAHRISRVLRLGPGAPLLLFDGSGASWSAAVARVEPHEVTVAVGERLAVGRPEPESILLACLIRPSRFEWLLEKATELGATAIQPVLSARTVVRATEIGPARLERWRRITVEAAEQCARLFLPRLDAPRPFAEALAGTPAPLFIAAEPDHGPQPPLGAALAGTANGPVSLLIGPEGGFTGDEVRVAIARGATAVSLGPRAVRAETAAIAALAILADARGQR